LLKKNDFGYSFDLFFKNSKFSIMY
jgi:hypothetical protein